jgi:hypothetical protein
MKRIEDDIKLIKDLMDRSTTFGSLSGLSGVGAGICALVGCTIAIFILEQNGLNYFDGKPNYYSFAVLRQLVLVALGTLIGATFFGTYFTMKKAKRLGVKIWQKPAENTLQALGIPLLTGGLFCILLVYHDLVYLVAPSMLIFYGLALVSASKYTHKELMGLGLIQITLGLLSCMFVGYGLVFWALGFGVLHIIYGTWMYYKYK